MITTKGLPPLKETEKWSAQLLEFFQSCVKKEIASRPAASELLKVRISAEMP